MILFHVCRNRRMLTPVCRVTFTKSLILPKFNHLFITLLTLNYEIISLLCKDKVEFLRRSQAGHSYNLFITLEA